MYSNLHYTIQNFGRARLYLSKDSNVTSKLLVKRKLLDTFETRPLQALHVGSITYLQAKLKTISKSTNLFVDAKY